MVAEANSNPAVGCMLAELTGAASAVPPETDEQRSERRQQLLDDMYRRVGERWGSALQDFPSGHADHERVMAEMQQEMLGERQKIVDIS